MTDKRTPRQRALVLEKSMRCCCDFDNWEPERGDFYTGHTWVCRIHKAAINYEIVVKAADPEETGGDND